MVSSICAAKRFLFVNLISHCSQYPPSTYKKDTFQPLSSTEDGEKPAHLQLTGAVEVIERLRNACSHSLLAFADPNTGVEVLLVRFVISIRVANGRLEVILLLQNVVSNAAQVRELKISVDIDLDNTVANSSLILLLRRAGSTMEDKKYRLVLFGSNLFLDVRLVFSE